MIYRSFDPILSRFFQERVAGPLDCSRLPYDCLTRAAQRLRESYTAGEHLDENDLEIVFRTSNKGIDPISAMERILSIAKA